MILQLNNDIYVFGIKLTVNGKSPNTCVMCGEQATLSATIEALRTNRPEQYEGNRLPGTWSLKLRLFDYKPQGTYHVCSEGCAEEKEAELMQEFPQKLLEEASQ